MILGARWRQVKRENVRLAGHFGGCGPAPPPPVTILVSGAVLALVEEAAGSVQRCLCRLRNAMGDRRVLPGAVRPGPCPPIALTSNQSTTYRRTTYRLTSYYTSHSPLANNDDNEHAYAGQLNSLHVYEPYWYFMAEVFFGLLKLVARTHV
jgi:hypothetical protein